MAWLPIAAAALGNIVGSSIGGNAQKSAAQEAANSQLGLLTQQENYLTQLGNTARGAIGSLLPYSHGASSAAQAIRGQIPFSFPGTGATFGGQNYQATPTMDPNLAQLQSMYAPLLSGGGAPPGGIPTSGPPLMSPTMPQMNHLARSLQTIRGPIPGQPMGGG